MMDLRKRDFLPALAFVSMSLIDASLQWQAQFDGYGVLAVLTKAVCAGLVLSAPMFWLGQAVRWFFVPLWCWLCFIETVEWATRLMYNRVLDGDWVMMLMSSSTSELTMFVEHFSPWRLFGLILLSLVMMGCGSWWLLRRFYPRHSWRLATIGGLFLMPAIVFTLLRPAGRGAFADMMYCYFLEDTIQNFQDYSDLARTARSPRIPALHLNAHQGEAPVGVIVVGESATRNSMHLYGYGRPTTPCLDERKGLVVFRNVRATRSTTASSLRMYFTEATEERPQKTYSTLSQWYAQSGYDCTLLSIQNQWGRWDGVQTLLFTGCRTRRYLSEESPSEIVFDDKLVPALKQDLANLEMPRMIFLHMNGSHFPACRQYPADYSVFPRDEQDVPPGIAPDNEHTRILMDTYDNSILFTDRVLGRILDVVEDLNRPSFFIYFSDHGDTPRSGFVRDQTSNDLFEVPFIVWFSPEYRKQFPDTVEEVEKMAEPPQTADHLFDLFLSLARVGKMGLGQGNHAQEVP